MPHIKINKDKCKGCLLCAAVCTRALIVRSIDLNKMGVHYVKFETKKNKGGCTGCSVCAIICPDVCIEVYR